MPLKVSALGSDAVHSVIDACRIGVGCDGHVVGSVSPAPFSLCTVYSLPLFLKSGWNATNPEPVPRPRPEKKSGANRVPMSR